MLRLYTRVTNFEAEFLVDCGMLDIYFRFILMRSSTLPNGISFAPTTRNTAAQFTPLRRRLYLVVHFDIDFRDRRGRDTIAIDTSFSSHNIHLMGMIISLHYHTPRLFQRYLLMITARFGLLIHRHSSAYITIRLRRLHYISRARASHSRRPPPQLYLCLPFTCFSCAHTRFAFIARRASLPRRSRRAIRRHTPPATWRLRQ